MQAYVTITREDATASVDLCGLTFAAEVVVVSGQPLNRESTLRRRFLSGAYALRKCFYGKYKVLEAR